MPILKEFCCIFCNLQLSSIFIKCEDCAKHQNHNNSHNNVRDRRFTLICLECFANGSENQHHNSFHSYRVVNLDRIETFNEWTLVDELELLNRLSTLNENLYFKRSVENDTSYLKIGDFEHEECVRHVEDWSQMFKNATNDQDQLSDQVDEIKLYKSRVKSTVVLCKEVSGNEMAAMPGFSNTSSQVKNTTFNLSLIRPQMHSKQFRLMSGYRPARGDFETEFNEKFESTLIADLDYEANSDLQLLDEPSCNDPIGDEELSFEEMNSVETSLKLNILNSYTDLIRERYERKRLIKKLGLLNELSQNEYALALLTSKATSSATQTGYRPSISHTTAKKDPLIQDNCLHLEKSENSSVSTALPSKFQRLFSSLDSYVKCVELFGHQAHLRKKIAELKEYRSNGVRSLKHVTIYKNLKHKRLNKTPSVHLGSLLTVINRYDENSGAYYCKNLCQEWFKKFVMSDKSYRPANQLTSSVETSTPQNITNSTDSVRSPPQTAAASASSYPASHLKYKNNPLKIENYPDCEKLNEDEKEFCRIARVQPTVYLRVKAVLVLENKKAGFCSYSRARKIAGIDVNKTRLIHNLMLKLDYLKANPPKE
jgi:hypothetical protein